MLNIILSQNKRNIMNDIEELQNTLFKIYNKNIFYLKNNHPDLYTKISNFEKLNVETKHIDFKDGYFELIEIVNNKNTYNCNSFYDAEYRAKHITESKAIFSMIVDKINSKNYNMKNEISAHKFVKEILDSKEKHSTISEKFIFIFLYIYNL